MNYTAWMIELPQEVTRHEHKLDNLQTSEFTETTSTPSWWCGKSNVGTLLFTGNPNEAVRFPTKECAEYVFKLLCIDIDGDRAAKIINYQEIITEHKWID
jgi:hypothetical protein